MTDPLPALDTALLDGFAFACRPDCGLCCFASPRITPRERDRLRESTAQVEIVGRGRDLFLASRPDGGACQFLRSRRCGVHALRPAPCREFPISVHVGTRLQATAVLSCPGLTLDRLVRPEVGASGSGPSGLERELESVRSRIDAGTARRVADAARRRRRIVRELESGGAFRPEDEVRAVLREEIPWPRDEEFPAEEPPPSGDGLATLPLYFDGRRGPVALSQGVGGWAVLELAEEGGVAADLGVVPPPERCPSTDDAGAELLRGYLRYWLERDALFGYLLQSGATEAGEDLVESTRTELRRIGAQVLSRAEVRAKVTGRRPGELGAAAVADGIRAYDQDGLDRPTWGDRL